MKKSIVALLLVVFIDAAGIGILFPILSDIIMSPQSHFLAVETSIAQREFLYGMTIAVFFFCWFIGATYLSKTSDQIGRKRALLICLCGIFIGYGLTALAIAFNCLTLLILGRILGGITAGSQPVAQAAIIDISSKQERTKNLGLIMFAFALGMVAGPIIGGVLSDTFLVSWFNHQLPFYLVLVLVLVNIFLLISCYQEQPPQKNEAYHFNVIELVTQFGGVFKNKNVLKLSIIFFMMQIAFNTFYVFLPVYLYRQYQYGVLMNSAVMLVLGLAMAISSIVLVPLLAKRSSQKQNVMMGLIVMALSLSLMLCDIAHYGAFIFGGVLMLCFGVAYTNMLGLFSHAVSEKEQGWVMGITVSLFTSGAAITSLFSGKLLDIALELPFILVVIVFVMSVVMLKILTIGTYINKDS
ncbi:MULTISPECIES: MFS transporter [Cysteiniphilum]|uniref:MFS transporter n=1 Tax=Cysteiniphilum TaxID=2056696 RepID=UPI001783F760|nr:MULTISPECIES: MFS transporter [Cysteiniphilum]